MPSLPNLRNKFPFRTELSMTVGYDEIIYLTVGYDEIIYLTVGYDEIIYLRGHFCLPHQDFLLTSALLSLLTTKIDTNREQT